MVLFAGLFIESTDGQGGLLWIKKIEEKCVYAL
jgi:hypothetical protein